MTRYTLTPAIPLGKKHLREDDVMYYFYTQRFGKISAVARGARKIQSKLSGHLEPFGVVDLGVVHTASRNRIAHAASIHRFFHFHENLDALMLGGYGLRLVNKVFHENSNDERVFHLLFDYLDIFNERDSERFFSFVNPAITLKILSFLGYTPEMELCVRCRMKVSGESYFSPAQGGVICLNCKKSDDSLYLFREERQMVGECISLSLREFLKKADSKMSVKFHTIASHFLMSHI